MTNKHSCCTTENMRDDYYFPERKSCKDCGRYEDTLFTAAKHHNYLMCPLCDFSFLKVTEDYNGGGSHYWIYICRECTVEYTFDTYRFKLEVRKKSLDKYNSLIKKEKI